jgi:hypothetical protein
MEKNKQTSTDLQNPEKDPGFRNIAKGIFLIAVLAGAWFVLDWLINGPVDTATETPPATSAVKPLLNPPLKWVNLLTYDMDEWNMKAGNAAFTACSGPRKTPEQFQACISEKVPDEVRTRTWSIPLHEGPSKSSKQVGGIRITGKVFSGFTMQFIAPDGAAVPFEPDNYLEYSDSEAFHHTVLEQREGWVLLPMRPFPTEVWIDAAGHSVRDVGDDVYEWNGQSIVILEKQETGVLARQEIPADNNCEGEAEPTPEDQIKKFGIPWSELYDENHHLRLKQKYTIC